MSVDQYYPLGINTVLGIFVS